MAKTLSFFLKLNDKQFQSGLRKNIQRLDKFGKKMKRTGQSLSQNLTLPLAALGVTSIKLASDFQETQAKFNTVFRDIQGQANQTAKTLQRDFGLSSKASMELLGNTGDLLTGFGFTQEEALKLSADVNKLAVDLASFTNVEGGAATASQALTKALLGERESVKQLGIAITEADLKAFAEEQGLVFKELDRVAKATLTFELAAKQSANAIGDYERTSGSFANQTRRLMADLENLGVEIGQILLPIAKKGIEFFKQLVNAFRNLSPEAQQNTVIIGILAGALGPLLTVLGSIVGVVMTLGIKFIAIAAAIAALALGILYVNDNWEAFIERFSDIQLWKNALISMIQFLVENSPIGLFLKGINATLKLLGRKEFPNPFEGIADKLKGLKKETKDYKVEFQDFSTFIGNQGKKIKKALAKVGDAFGVGTPSGGGATPQGQKSGLEPLGDSVGFNAAQFDVHGGLFQFVPSPIIEPKAFSLIVKTKEEVEALNEAAKELAETQKQVANTFQSAFHSMAASADASFGDIAAAAGNAARQVIKAKVAEATASYAADAFAKLGLLGGILAAAAGSVVGSLFNKIIPPFAEGGMVSGATLAMVGEGPGTSAINPEVIAPLDKLQGMIGNAGGQVQVVGKISGSDILLASDRARGNRNRTRGY